MRRRIVLVSLAALLVLPLLVRGQEVVVVPREVTLPGNAFRLGERVDIDGTVEGDAIVLGSVVNVAGTVKGDLIVASQRLTVTGSVGGNLRALAGQAILKGPVGRNVTLATFQLTQAESSTVAGSFAFLAQEVVQRGTVQGSLDGVAETVVLTGTVGQDAVIRQDVGLPDDQPGTTTVQAEAKITGALRHTGAKPAHLAAGATVAGGVIERAGDLGAGRSLARLRALWQLISFVSLAIVGLIVLWLFRRENSAIDGALTGQFWKSVLVGLAAFFLTPIVSFLLGVTLVGIPLALILFVSYLIALYLTKVYVAVLLGRWLVRFGERRSVRLPSHWATTFLIGLITLTVFLEVVFDLLDRRLPFFGVLAGLISLFIAFWGLGGIILGKWRTLRAPSP